MKKAIIIPLSTTVLIMAGSLTSLLFAQSDMQSERKILLAQEAGSEAWHKANAKRERDIIKHQREARREAQREARAAQKAAREARQRAREARQRFKLALEPIL